VGLPRESKISRVVIFFILGIEILIIHN